MDDSRYEFAAFASCLPHPLSCKLLFLLLFAAFAAFASTARYVRIHTHTHTHTRARITCIFYRQMRQMRQTAIQVIDFIEISFCLTFGVVRQMRQIAFYNVEKRGLLWI